MLIDSDNHMCVELLSSNHTCARLLSSKQHWGPETERPIEQRHADSCICKAKNSLLTAVQRSDTNLKDKNNQHAHFSYCEE